MEGLSLTKPISSSILLVYPSCFYYPSWMERLEMKTSMLLLASYLDQFCSISYVDFELSIGRPNSATQIRRYERHVREYFENNPHDILALSCWTSLSYQATLCAARIWRELYPNKLIVVGGYHAAARPQEFLLEDNPVDFVVCGEGEIALRDIAREFAMAGRPRTGTVVKAPMFPQEEMCPINWNLIEDLFRKEFPQGIYNLYMYTSRGCPFGCSFCMEPMKDRKWRARMPRESLDELLSAARKFKPLGLAAADACFGMRPAWRKEFLRLLVQERPDFWFVMETRPEYLDNEDIELLAQLKYVEVQLGLESCSPDMLRLMKKTKSPEKFLESFRLTSHRLSEKGVLHRANLIFNHPGETRATLDETFAFIDRELADHNSYLIWGSHGYMHFPGCELDTNREYYEKTFGSRFLKPAWWMDAADQYEASMQFVPSRDLDGDNRTLWNQMHAAREKAMKGALSPRAFKFAAEKYFFEWKADPRYEKN